MPSLSTRRLLLVFFFDAASDAIAVPRAEDLEGSENHQGERAPLRVEFGRHVPVLWDTHTTVTSATGPRKRAIRSRLLLD